MKTVKEVEVKLFTSYSDSLSDSNYLTYVVDLEGTTYPECVFKDLDIYKLKCLKRENDRIEKVYIKIS